MAKAEYLVNKELLNKMLDKGKDFKVIYGEDHEGAHWDTEDGDILFYDNYNPDTEEYFE